MRTPNETTLLRAHSLYGMQYIRNASARNNKPQVLIFLITVFTLLLIRRLLCYKILR